MMQTNAVMFSSLENDNYRIEFGRRKWSFSSELHLHLINFMYISI